MTTMGAVVRPAMSASRRDAHRASGEIPAAPSSPPIQQLRGGVHGCPTCGRTNLTLFRRAGEREWACADCSGLFEVFHAVTPIQLHILGAVAVHGNQSEAAQCLGRSVRSVWDGLRRLHAALGTRNTIESLTTEGWLQVPPEYRCHPEG